MVKKTIFAMLCLSAFSASADVKLELPDNVKLRVVNEQDANRGLFGVLSTSDNVISLPNGENQIVFQVDEYFYKGGKQSERVFSNPVIFKFDAKDEKLILELPTFESRTDLEHFSLSPMVVLKSEDNRHVAVSYDAFTLRGFAVTNDFVDNTRIYNIQNQPAAYSKYTQADINEANNKVGVNVSSENELKSEFRGGGTDFSENADTMLKYWFLKASQQEQKDFMSWAFKNMK